MDANAYANDDDDENGHSERDVEWEQWERGDGRTPNGC